MKLVIQGKEYDLLEAIQKASISDLILLKRATTSADYKGVSIKTIMDTLGAIDDVSDFLDSVEALENLRGIIFLCRRKAGEMLTPAQAVDFPLSDLAFAVEEEVEDEVDDGRPKDEAADVPPTSPS